MARRDPYPTHRRCSDDYCDGCNNNSHAQERPSRRARKSESGPAMKRSLPNYIDKDQNQRSRDKYRQDVKANIDMPFEKAMRLLHKELDRSYSFYERFRNEFEDEIRAISIYADSRILDELWIMKVMGRSAAGRWGNTKVLSSQKDPNEDDLKTERDAMLFVVMRRKIFEALTFVWRSRIGEGSSKPKKSSDLLDFMMKMHGKMKTADKQIRGLLFAATESSRNCEQLLNGLRKFKELIDPESEGNILLYKGAGDGDDIIDAGNTDADGNGNVMN